MSVSNFVETTIMDALFNNASPTALQLSARYIKLHIGDPGEAGTANAAGETTRQAVTFGASSNGVISLASGGAWTNVSTSETYSHVSLWDHVSAGNCLGSGALAVAKAVVAGDNFSLSTLTFTFA